MAEKTNVMRIFDKLKIDYKEYTYEGGALSGTEVAKQLYIDEKRCSNPRNRFKIAEILRIYDPRVGGTRFEKSRRMCEGKVAFHAEKQRSAAADGLRARRLFAGRDEKSFPDGHRQRGARLRYVGLQRRKNRLSGGNFAFGFAESRKGNYRRFNGVKERAIIRSFLYKKETVTFLLQL